MAQQRVISGTFNVRTIDETVSLQAQYAPNDNPTSSQIHNTWQDGDLYMRTKMTNETTWSEWHKIVGESGDETEYTFNISKSLTSSSATTAPANCYYNTWQDAPIAPTSTYPYLWMKIVKKTWNESTQSYDSGTARYARMTGEPGTSPYFADLNNEMDAIQCNHDGGVIADQTVSTVISMWKGSAVEAFAVDNIYRNGTQLTWNGNNNGVWPRVLSGGTTVAIEFDTSASIADIDYFKITIHSTNDTSVTRELHFTINGVRSNAIYRLVPSHSQIVKKKNGTYEPSINITCSVEKNENGSTSTPSSSEYTLEKSVNGGSYVAYSATAPSSITSDLKFRLKVGSVVVDLETIPLVKDGQNGDNAVNYKISLAGSQFAVDPNQSGGLLHVNIAGKVYKIVGNTTSAYTDLVDTYLSLYYEDSNGSKDYLTTSDFTVSGATFATTYYDGTGWSDERLFVAILTVGGVEVARESIQIEVWGMNGSNGQRGKVGRFFYFGGTFNAEDESQTFIVNDAQAPYFEHSETITTQSGTTTVKRYHVFNYDTNGTYTMAQMWAIRNNWNYKPWEVMMDDFKYIITQALFADFAHLGSAIINGDWMLSQHGTRNGVASTEYTKFDQNYPNTDHAYQDQSHNFIPNYCVDLLTGETYQNRAFVSGTVYAESGYFNGSLRTTFHDISNESGWVYYSPSDTRPSGMGVGWNYLVGDYDNMCMLAKKTIPLGGTANNLHVRLPNTLSMIGRRIILYEMNQPPFSTGASFFEIRQLNGAAFVGVSAGGHGTINFQAVYGILICGGVVEFLAVPHPTDATICTWAITNIDGCIWDYTTTQ